MYLLNFIFLLLRFKTRVLDILGKCFTTEM
jgi:hypothetical protein